MLWIEIRCGDQSPPTGFTDKCLSFTNDGPSAMVSPVTVAHTALIVAQISKVAKSQGWKKIDGDWICPHCLRIRSGAAESMTEA